MSLRIRIALAAAVAALSFAVVAPARADITIGQTGGYVFYTCPTAVYADTHYVVPSGGGTITSFSFDAVADNAGDTLDFLILRPTSTPGDYTVVGKTGVVTLAGTGLETFTADIPVQSGDILAFHAVNAANCSRDSSAGGAIQTRPGAPDPSVGDTVAVTESLSFFELNLSANLVTGPTSKAQCKKGGWMTFGSMFANQGQCVTLFDT